MKLFPRHNQEDPGHHYDNGEPVQDTAAVLSGPQASLLTLGKLKFDRDTTGVRATTNTLSDIRWAPAQDFGMELHDAALEKDPKNGAPQLVWHSGHVTAILSDGAVAIVATQSGGVWVVNPRTDAVPIANSHQAFALSDDWSNAEVSCLAFAPGSTTQFFAGCGFADSGPIADSGALFFVELETVLGGMEPKRSTSIPLPFLQGLQQIVVVDALRRIVLATQNGVWWSPIPTVASNASQYAWRRAIGLPDGTYAGLAEGPGQTLAAAAWGVTTATGHFGMFAGGWEGSDLVFAGVSPRNMGGVDPSKMVRISITSCDADRSVMYTVASGADQAIFAVLTSNTGGASWRPVATPEHAGVQGQYANCIAVSPFHKDIVVLGWVAGGPFFSTNGGRDWTRPFNDITQFGIPGNSHLHADLHALYFTRNQDGEDHLFLGGDGGVVHTRDLGHTWDSRYNKHLGTLQFCFKSDPMFRNHMTVSSRFPGLIACGTQDNGNLYCDLSSSRPSWQVIDGGDGGPHRFIDALGVLLRYNNTKNHVMLGSWHAATGSFAGSAVVPVDGDAAGLLVPLIELVRSPAFSRDGKLMYAMAATTQIRSPQSTLDTPQGRVYGFFANPDGSGATFSLLAEIGDRISSLASRDGHTILIGTPAGRIVSLDSASGVLTSLDIPSPLAGSGSFIRLADLEAQRAFALHDSGRILRYDGSTWAETAGGGFRIFEADPRPRSHRLFAATENSVLVSTNDGDTWANASNGLPASPHCTDLRIASDGQGGHDLYLATYGRSVWKAKADQPAPVKIPPNIPGAVLDIIAGVIGDGGGLVEIGGQIFRIPPRAPARDILGALVVAEIASFMSEEAGREIRLAAMRTVRDLAEAQIRRLNQGH